MASILLHGISTIALLGLLVFLLKTGQKRPLLVQPGWPLLLGASAALAIGGLAGFAGGIHPDGQPEAHGLAGVGFIGGALLLIGGLIRWLPHITSLEQVEGFAKQLTDSYARLEIHNQELRAKGERFRSISHSAQDAIIATDSEGLIRFWNAGAEMIFGYREQDALGRDLQFIMPTRYREAHDAGFRRVKASGETHLIGRTVELEGVARDGREIPLEMTLASWTTEGERFFVSVMRDITTRRESEKGNERLHQSRVAISALLQTALEPLSLEEQLRKSLEIILAVPWLSIQSKGSIFLVDQRTGDLVLTVQMGLADHLLSACARIPPGYCLCGKAAESREIIYSSHMDHRHDVTFEGIQPHGHYCVPIISQERLLGVVNMYLPDGHPEDSEEEAFLRALADTLAGVIERKRMEKHLEHLAHHDTLTGLPNRKFFAERLGQELSRANREESLLAVMFLDLDRFKQVNDTLGHEVGDRLLIEVSHRLKGCLREGDTVARLGGDEFAVILPGLKGREIAGVVARKIIARLVEPFHLLSQTCYIGTSIGVSFFPEDGEEGELLLQQADVAMYAVKRSGRNNYLCFTPEMVEETETAAGALN